MMVFCPPHLCFPVDKLTVTAYFETHQNRENPLPDGLVDMDTWSFPSKLFEVILLMFPWKLGSLAQNDGMDFPTNREPSPKKTNNVNQQTFLICCFFLNKKLNSGRVMIKSGGIFWFGWFGAFHVKIKFGNSRGPTLGGSLRWGGGNCVLTLEDFTWNTCPDGP